MIPTLKVSGVGPHLAAILAEKGITTADQLAATLPAVLQGIPGIGAPRAQALLKAANLALKGGPAKSSGTTKAIRARKAPATATSGDDTAKKKTKEEKAGNKEGNKAEKKAAKKAARKKKLKEKAAAKKVARKKAAKRAEKKAAKKAARKAAKKAEKKAAKKAARKKSRKKKRDKSGKK